MKIKALAFVLTAVLLLCGCGQKSETAAATPAQAVTAPAAQSSMARPAWFITLGQSGTTDVRMEDCTVRAEYCETIFRMVGDKTRAVVDNCDITMKQPDSMAEHDMKKGANPMLARGNDRADGSTVIQNSRITLSGDNGRRICYQLSALKGNTLDVSLGCGIASTKEVSGNTIRGRIRHKVFQDCSGVENNNVDVRRFSILG